MIIKYPSLRYLTVGVINTIFGYTIFAILMYFGLHYALAILFATMIGIIFNFQTISIFVFKLHEWRRLGYFAINYCVLYFINILVLKMFLFFSSNIYLDNALVIILIAILGFFSNKRFVYAQKN